MYRSARWTGAVPVLIVDRTLTYMHARVWLYVCDDGLNRHMYAIMCMLVIMVSRAKYVRAVRIAFHAQHVCVGGCVHVFV